jgi:hypothetical protein
MWVATGIGGIVVGCFIGYRICLLAKFGMFGRSNV